VPVFAPVLSPPPPADDGYDDDGDGDDGFVGFSSFGNTGLEDRAL
jgi:hypothetical protein